MVDAIENYRNSPGTRAVRERLNNMFSHSPEVESSLRDMDTEKLVKVLASRPNLIPMSEWTSSPEMYDLYKETRQQLGLPTNEGRIQTQALLPEGARTPIEANYLYKAPPLVKPKPRTYNPIEPKYPGNQPIYGSLHDFREPSPQDVAAPTPPKDEGLPPATGGQNLGDLKRPEDSAPTLRTSAEHLSAEPLTPPKIPQETYEDVTFSPSAVSPYANLQRIDETQPVVTVRKQEETRAGQVGQLLQDIKRNIGLGAFSNGVDINMYDSKAQKTLSPSQYAALKAEKDKVEMALNFYNNPEVEKYLLEHPTVLIRASGDPFGVRNAINDALHPDEAPKSEAGVASVANAAPSPAPSGVAAASNIAPSSTLSSVGGGNEYGGEDNLRVESDFAAKRRQALDQHYKKPNAGENGVSLEDDMASLRKSATRAAPAAAPAASQGNSGPTTAVDPLTRKSYAPVGQSSAGPSYRDDSALVRSGPNGEETATDFVLNQPIYKKRMEDQPPMEARGGPISHGGNPHDDKCHVGIIHMAVGGRTDHLPMNVYANSYVIPADVVSGLGEGNTLAGGKVMDHMFSGDSLRKMVNKTVKSPLKRASGGDATSDSDAVRKAALPGITMPKNIDFSGIDFSGGMFGSKMTPIHGSSTNFGPTPYQYRWTPDQKSQVKAAHGGMINDRQMHPVEIIAAGGEYVIPPEVVRALGHGDAESGHKWLDNFVKSTRAHTIKTMQNLPGPKKD